MTTNTIIKNSRLLLVFSLGLVMIVIGGVGLKYIVGGIAMAPLTGVAFEVAGAAILLLAWIDLDRVGVKAFFALIGSAFVVELTHYHEPKTDALLQELLNNPQALTPERRVELKEAMVSVSNNPKFSDRERRVAAVMPELIDLALDMERSPRARH